MRASEFELIERLRELLPESGERLIVGPGDDAAVTQADGLSITSIDSVVEGVHFTLPQFPLAAVGRKAMAAALSDLAAMGAGADEAYVAAGLPASLSDDDCLQLFGGLVEAAGREGAAIAGGNITAAPVLTLAITVVGHEPPGARLVTRAGAKPGDAVVVSGKIGGAAAALRLLEEPVRGAVLDDAERKALLARQLDPRPRLGAGRALAACGATAMIDVSDGLVADADHLARAGGVQLDLRLDSIPLQAGAATVLADAASAEIESSRGSRDQEAARIAASGGDDLELLACLPAAALGAARSAVRDTGCDLTEVGVVAEGEGAILRDLAGVEVAAPGFDHRRR